VNEEEFYAGTYLHQEAVRDIILGPPETRTVIIDRLLGIHHLKEISDGIPLTYIRKASRNLEDQINKGEEIRDNIVKFSKESLEVKKEELREDGTTEDELKFAQISKSLRGLSENLLAYAETAGLRIQELTEPPRTFELLEKAYSRLREDYSRVRMQTGKVSQSWIEELSKLKPIQAEYQTLHEKIPLTEARTKLELENQELENEIQVLQAKLQPLRRQAEELRLTESTFTQLLQQAETAQRKLEQSEERLGTKTQIEGQYAQVAQQIDKLENELKASQRQLEDARAALSTISQIHQQLNLERSDVPELQTALEEAKQEISSIEKRFGIRTQIQARLEAITPELKEKQQIIERTEAYDRVLSASREYLEQQEEDTCPVCKRPIDHRELLDHVVKEIGALTKAKIIQTAQENIKTLKREHTELEEALRQLEKLKKELEDAQRRLELRKDAITKLEAKLGELNEELVKQKQKTAEQQLSTNRAKLTEYTRKKSELDNLRRQFEVLTREREDAELRLRATKETLQRLGVKLAEQLTAAIAERLGNLQWEISTSETRVDDLSRRQGQLRSRLVEVDEIESRLHKLDEQLKQSVGAVRPEGWYKLHKRIAGLESNIDRLSKSQEQLELIEDEIHRMGRVIAYLGDEEAYQKQAESLPDVRRTIEKLQAKKERLADLEEVLSTIAQAAATIREDMAKKSLSALRDSINNYFTELHGHRHYSSLELQPETERGRQLFSLVATSPDGKSSTYLQTRFSNAQLNIAALSLFLAFSEKLPGNIGFTILDDPSQSLDQRHKEALAQQLAELSKKRQIIVTTQDEGFLSMLEKASPSLKTFELSEWTTEGLAIKYRS